MGFEVNPEEDAHLNVFSVEDLEGFLQTLDLLLAAGDTLLVGDTGVNAVGFQLVIVGERGVELLLSSLQISLLLR